MNGGLELKPKSLDELFRQYMANSGTQEQSQISPMDYLNMDDGQNESDMANDNPLQKTDSFVNLLKGDQTVQPEQKKQGGNIIEDFLGGLGKAVGGIAKVGAAVVAPTAVNAFYDQRQKMANNKLEAAAKEYIAQNQGNGFDINTVVNHLKQNYPDDFKHADLSKVYDGVTTAYEPINTFTDSKIKSDKDYNKIFLREWGKQGNTGFIYGGKVVPIKISADDFRDKITEKYGINFTFNPDKPYDETGPLYQVSEESLKKLTPEAWKGIFKMAQDNGISTEAVRQKFNLFNQPDYKAINANLRAMEIAARAKRYAQTGGLTASQQIAYGKWAENIHTNNQNKAALQGVTVDDTAKLLASGGYPEGVVLPGKVDLVKMGNLIKDADRSYNDAVALAKSKNIPIAEMITIDRKLDPEGMARLIAGLDAGNPDDLEKISAITNIATYITSGFKALSESEHFFFNKTKTSGNQSPSNKKIDLGLE